MNNDIQKLVEDLPEVYQSIYGHTKLSYDVSRVCEDRFIEIKKVYNSLEKELNRPLRVLDLGCAQGFFSLSLAELGATVQGVDFLDKNIAVCEFLAKEHPTFKIKFNVGRIEDILSKLEKNQYDLVLGLSVFHHIVHEHGVESVQIMLKELAVKIKAAVFELALTEEPLYWGNSQAKIPTSLLNHFHFVHEIKKYPTHLSHINRPLVVASNYYCIFDDYFGEFESYIKNSHNLAQGVHQDTRKYFFNEKTIVKQFSLNNKDLYQANMDEYEHEVDLLNRYANRLDFPKLITNGKNNDEAWIVREKYEGTLLLDFIENNINYDADTVINDVLSQVVKLEKEGLFHNDMRVWNILIDGKGSARLIDYGSIINEAKDCVKPNNLFLAFFVLIQEITTRRAFHPAVIRDVIYNIELLPEPYKTAYTRLFLLNDNEISFAKLKEFIALDKLTNMTIPSGFNMLSEAQYQTNEVWRKEVVYFKNIASQAEAKATQTQEKATQAEERATQAEERAVQAEERAVQAEERAVQAEDRTNDTLHHYHMVLNSNSWKLTKPYRLLGQKYKWFKGNAKAWLTFAPSSRPRKTLKKLLLMVKHKLNSHPKIKNKLLSILHRFPTLKKKIMSIGKTKYPHVTKIQNDLHGAQLSGHANEIYQHLKTKIAKAKKV